MKKRRSLHAQIMFWLGGYAVLLAGVIVLFLADEFLEDMVWESMLKREIAQYLQRKAADPGYRWQDTDSLRLYGAPDRPPPSGLSMLPHGVHDDFWLDGRENVVLVQRVKGVDYVVVRDITELEVLEDTVILASLALALILVVVVGVLVAWGLRRSLRPLSDLAGDIAALAPDHAGQHITVGERASSELHVIANALNDYLRRQDAFVERERAFIDTTSHELRTPIAVIAGAGELALDQPGLPATAHNHLQRIVRTAHDVEQLISLLLVLAKDPARLAGISDRFSLDQLLPEIVEDHRHLTRDKDLSLALGAMPACEIVAPLIIVQAAIGNLLRNAIEHSDRGEIRIRLEAGATVVIEDPGHGMSPEEISQLYARVARGNNRDGGGIGLDLISRLCEHLGWSLDLSSDVGHGTTTTLRLSRQQA